MYQITNAAAIIFHVILVLMAFPFLVKLLGHIWVGETTPKKGYLSLLLAVGMHLFIMWLQVVSLASP